MKRFCTSFVSGAKLAGVGEFSLGLYSLSKILKTVLKIPYCTSGSQSCNMRNVFEMRVPGRFKNYFFRGEKTKFLKQIQVGRIGIQKLKDKRQERRQYKNQSNY